MKTLTEGLRALDLEATPTMVEQFAAYMEGILDWNQKVNLTAITDRQEFLVKHYLDSLLCAGQPQVRQARTVVDVGTGAGFPGVPLAILFPDKSFTLLDSLAKRLRIVDELCEKIGLTNVTTVHGRAEDLARQKAYRAQYDLCVSRAVAPLPVLAEYCLPFLRTGGWLLAYKGPDAEAELKAARRGIQILGGEFSHMQTQSLADFGLDHRVLFIQKVRTTPATYPRKAGTPSKAPLK